MDEISLKNENGQVVTSSRDVAEKFGKRHDSILRDIDNILKSNNRLASDFVLSTYKNSRGKTYRCYFLTDVAKNILETKYAYSVMNPRFELKFENMLRELFPSVIILSQYHILNYRIDFLMPDLQIIIEYDEEQHRYTKKSDQERITKIKKELNMMLANGISFYDGDYRCPKPELKYVDSFSVIRVEKGQEINGLRNICMKITEKTLRPCSDFMKMNYAA